MHKPRQIFLRVKRIFYFILFLVCVAFNVITLFDDSEGIFLLALLALVLSVVLNEEMEGLR